MSAREILEKLVSFPTISRESNLELIDWVEEYLNGHGVTCHRDYNEEGTKASLFANVGPEVEGGIVMSGHVDVVPVDGQDWDSDPFQVVEKDGRLYGRGTCDMKGFDAIALAAVPQALARGLKRPLQIALTRDEEIGCIGAPPMIEKMAAILPRAESVIVGEPSMMQAVTGHKGSIGYEIVFRGFEVHSSIMHQGVSAIMQAARLIDWANRRNDENMARTPTGAAAIFEPPFSTLHVGMISGGTAHNITAAECRLWLDFRLVPDEEMRDWSARMQAEIDRIEAGMQAIHPNCRIEVSEYFRVPGLKPETAGTAEALARAITGDNGSHVVSYGTEAGQFQEKGYSAVICGPGDIAQAHQPNEYVTLAQFAAAERFAERVIDHLAR